MLTRGQGEHIHWGLRGNLNGLVPQLKKVASCLILKSAWLISSSVMNFSRMLLYNGISSWTLSVLLLQQFIVRNNIVNSFLNHLT